MNLSDRAVSKSLIQQAEIYKRCIHPQGGLLNIAPEVVESSIPDLFEEQVREKKENLAYLDGGLELTFEALNSRANGIAKAILNKSASDNEPVVALLDEGADRICSFLGILKAGKCHIAISPDLPLRRLEYICRQSDGKVILTQGAYLELAQKLAGKDVSVINLDALSSDTDVDNPERVVDPGHRCMIVYTSGSTGNPKGVVQTHRAMLHDMRNNALAYNISSLDRVSLLMSLTTNAGCFNTIMALCRGATLCRIDVQGKGVDHMTKEVDRLKLTIWGGVPSLFRQWMTFELPSYPHLRLVWFGGETLHRSDFQLYKEKLGPTCIFVNRLGSTETGCTRRFYADQDTHISGPTVPIGYSVDGQEIFLIDDDGNRMTGPGTGEIVVRSSYLSTGYWKKPELTEKSFIQDGSDSRLRLFKTGDLGELDEDGRLTHLGRKDFQVQIRGFRVELAEVETAINQLDAVKEAVAIGEPLEEGGHELVAYLVAKHQPGPSVKTLQTALTNQLPDYMIPTTFVSVDHLPRAANGKILRNDVKSLSPLELSDDTEWIPPRNKVEAQLVEIWEELLNTRNGRTSEKSRVGVRDDFLALGGHSLKATQMAWQIKKRLSVEIPIQTIFDSATLEDLAIEIQRKRNQ